MYGLMCFHETPGPCSLRADIFSERVSCLTSKIGVWWYQVPQCAEVIGGNWVGCVKIPSSGSPPLDMRHQDSYMVVSAVLQSQRDGFGWSIMAQRPLPTLRDWYPWPPSQLWQVWHRLLHIPRPLFQKGQPCHDLSQQAWWWGCRPGRQILYPLACV